MRQLHYFNHGLGDCVQFTSIIKHLKKYVPDLILDVCTGYGKHSCFNNLADNVYLNSNKSAFANIKYDKIITHHWPENYNSYGNYPSTKTVKCLIEKLKLPINESLLNYTIYINQNDHDNVNKYLNLLPCNNGFVGIHYQGNSSTHSKNLDHNLIHNICEFLIKLKFTPIILDWDFRSRIPDNKYIYCPGPKNLLWGNHGIGVASTIAALISKFKLFIGIDSGPLHVAMSTNTKTFGIWTKHHPIHFADFSKNTTHFIPSNHLSLIRGGRKKTFDYFTNKYNYIVYSNLLESILKEIEIELKKSEEQTPKKIFSVLYNENDSKILTSFKYNEAYYEEHKKAGLDYSYYGDWQKRYGTWIVDSFNLKNEKILDLGCACGSIANGLQEAGAKVSAIDLNNHTVKLGKEKFPNLDINVCDCVNIHLYKDKEFKFVHCNQVAEHWRPEHTPLIFKEVYRILQDEGYFLCILDTQELYDRQKRDPLKEDPTHICIKPMNWWLKLAEENNFKIIHNKSFLENNVNSFFKIYDWDYFLLRKNKKLNKIYT